VLLDRTIVVPGCCFDRATSLELLGIVCQAEPARRRRRSSYSLIIISFLIDRY
jgi:hypothetical protein